MSIWRFDVALVARDGKGTEPKTYGTDVRPLSAQTVAAARAELERRFGRSFGIEQSVCSFGRPLGNRVDVIDVPGGTRELWASIDARSDADRFCTAVCQLADDLGCDLFSPDLDQCFAPTRMNLFNALMSSRAWVYALDPEPFERQASHRSN